jgi:hypothetical protein
MKLTDADRDTMSKATVEYNGNWNDPRPSYAEYIYRAGLRAGIERAAKVCEHKGYEGTSCDRFAAAIRALLTEEPREEKDDYGPSVLGGEE